jgi:hypothetical protein
VSALNPPDVSEVLFIILRAHLRPASSSSSRIRSHAKLNAFEPPLTAATLCNCPQARIASAWTSQTSLNSTKTKTTATLRSRWRHARKRNHPTRQRNCPRHSTRAAADDRCSRATASRDAGSLAHPVSRVRSLRRLRCARTRHSIQTRPLVGSVQSKRAERRLSNQRRQAVHDSDSGQQH